MPVEFLTEAQMSAYARFEGDPSDVELARCFYLDAADWQVLAGRRGAHNRLGLALQLCTVRYLGTFLTDVREIPERVISYVARQLDVPDPLPQLQRYHASEMRRDHVADLKRRYGYRDFTDPLATFPLVRLLYLRAWTSADRPSALFAQAVEWLQRHKVLLPGITTLVRFVARVRDRAASRVWRALSRAPSAAQRMHLERLLTATATAGGPRLETLRQGQTRISAPALLRALDRVEAIRSLGAASLDLSHIPPRRLTTLAAYAITSKTAAIAELADDRRLATLVAFASVTEKTACDDALDVLDALVDQLLRDALHAHRRERLRTLRDLDGAALILADRSTDLLAYLTRRAFPTDPYTPYNPYDHDRTHDEAAEPAEVAVLGYLTALQDELQTAIARIQALARPPGETFEQEVRTKYRTVRAFLPRLLRTLEFTTTQAASALAEAAAFLRWLDTQRHTSPALLERAPLAFVPAGWRRHVQPPGQPVDRQMYTLCFVAQLQASLRKREVFVPSSARWSDPRAQLLQGAEWEAMRPPVCQLLHRVASANEELAAWERELDAAYQHAAGSLPDGVRIETVVDARTGTPHDRLHLAGVDPLPEPPSLLRLRALTNHRLPVLDLGALLLEMESRTGFAAEFTHIGGGQPRLDDFPVSLCATLMIQACNLPVSAVAQHGEAALEADRLVHVQQNYLRPETIARANARLVAFHHAIPLALQWGGGEVASADGLRFVVPVRTVNAGPNPKYFGAGRGVTLLNYTLDHFFGFNGALIPGTIRDSLFILDGLLEQAAPQLQPHQVVTDSASYSDMVFGLFSLLGYRFTPRLADLADTRVWRFDPQAHYGPLDRLSRHRLDRTLLVGNWDDVLRVVGSLKLGRVRASDLMHLLQGGGRPSVVGRAIGEVGRIAKSLHLLDLLTDAAYQRGIQAALNRGEARHSLARAVFHGRRGELRQAYREGQEEQLGALGLVVNLIVIWNTLYLDRALADLYARGVEVARADLVRLSPLGHDHIQLLGHYSFALADPVRRGDYLLLRAVDAAALPFA